MSSIYFQYGFLFDSVKNVHEILLLALSRCNYIFQSTICSHLKSSNFKLLFGFLGIKLIWTTKILENLTRGSSSVVLGGQKKKKKIERNTIIFLFISSYKIVITAAYRKLFFDFFFFFIKH